MKPSVFLLNVLALSAFIKTSPLVGASKTLKEDCKLDKGDEIITCDNTGDVHNLTAIPFGDTCLVDNGEAEISTTCVSHLETSTDVADVDRVKRQAFTTLGLEVGAMFGPIGAAVGAGIGFVGDILCMFFCGSGSDAPPPPPPNKPPVIKKGPVLNKAPRIIVPENEKEVVVSWQEPVIEDPEDGPLDVTASPNFKSGQKFGHGQYNIFFSARDKEGLIAPTKSLYFEVKVIRCDFMRWPDNGDLKCSSTDHIRGTTCSVVCDTGYVAQTSGNVLKCGEGGWQKTGEIDCKPIDCKPNPSITNGEIVCASSSANKGIYGSVCEVVCDRGYDVSGPTLVACDKQGNWNLRTTCIDNLPPRFTECPPDIHVNIDSMNKTAEVTWSIPGGTDNTDNSGSKLTITEIHGYKPNQRFGVGSHFVKYTIQDQEGNRGDSCIFSITVNSVSCQPPESDLVTKEHMHYHCSDFSIGSECRIYCEGGYPLAGADKIACNFNHDGVHWTFDQGVLQPFCKKVDCPELPSPLNGAMSCSQWTYGEMCFMQCQQGFDIPNIGDGQFVCSETDGTWNPVRVPDCNRKVDPQHLHLRSDFLYYTGKCNSSAENLQRIQENFINALNTSRFKAYCVGHDECKSEFVSIKCGTTTNRRRREVDIDKRSSHSLAYIVTFDLVVPFEVPTNRTAQDVYDDQQNVLLEMSDAIQTEVDTGKFDIPGLRVDSNSFGPGFPQYICPRGTMPRQTTASCVGCPIGQYFSEDTGYCEECNVGYYQDAENSLVCKACPVSTNTTMRGAKYATDCIEYCEKGSYSETGLKPCKQCDRGMYQDKAMSVMCYVCPSGMTTDAPGSIDSGNCKAYDVQLLDAVDIYVNKSVAESTFSAWLKLRANALVWLNIVNNDASLNMTFQLAPTVTVELNRRILGTAQTKLSRSAWTHIAITLNSTEIKIYADGKEILMKDHVTLSRSRVLDVGDHIVLKGECMISNFLTLDKKESQQQIDYMASTCSPNMSNPLFSTRDLLQNSSSMIVIPSKCDSIDGCRDSPCGVHDCVDKEKGYECHCRDGFTGTNCTVPPDYCATGECQNDATCVNGNGNYTCNCVKGYRGNYCEVKAVDGKWSPWTPFTECSLTCGGGVMARSRQCDSPPADVDGEPCHGQANETKACNENKCPECSRLRRSYGLAIHCNKTEVNQRCTVTCRPGLYFTTPPLPVYECGLSTGYKWNHQDESNPSSRLPACSNVQPPAAMGVTFDGDYDSVPCTDTNLKATQDNMAAKLSQLDCVKDNMCLASIKSNECKDSRKRRSTGTGLRTTVEIMASVQGSGTGVNIADVMQNNTAPSADLVNFVKLTMELEKAAQKIANNSVSFFQVTIDGTNHSVNPGPSGLPFRSSIVCPSGHVRMEVFCAECPAGSYSDGVTVFMCPRGQYQDKTGQSSCKQCPLGFTTPGVGSTDSGECSDSILDILGTRNNGNDDEHKGDDGSKAVKIGVGVSVSISMLVLATIAIVLVYKHWNKKRQVNDSCVDLNDHAHVIPSKPKFIYSAM